MKKSCKALILKRRLTKLFRTTGIVLFLMCLVVDPLSTLYAQNQPSRIISGSIKDPAGQPLLGVSVLVKDLNIGTISDVNGNFSLSVPGNAQTLVFSFVGMETQEVAIGNQTVFTISLAESAIGLGEVVVVGYGSQKKASIVGAIVQTSNEELRRTGGVVNLSHALAATLPGVTTIQSSGMPGRDDPRIIIRAVGTWNNSSPLILIDGIERKMGDIDVSEVETISVLKDASATAMFGVKGAEGVILITTRRGKVGKPQLQFDFNTTMKMISKVPDKLDSYAALDYRNQAIEYENPVRSDLWSWYTPIEVLNHYKKPQLGTTAGFPDEFVFPNIDWPEVMLKDAAMSYRANINISGGTDFAKYFGSLAYNHDGDLLNSGVDNGKDYTGQYAYDRVNYRTNLDFNLTKSTIFSANISGYVGKKIDNYVQEAYGTESIQYQAFYSTAPNSFVPRFPTGVINGTQYNGEWGFNPLYTNVNNTYEWINTKGVETVTRTQVSTDFKLTQKLDFITEGLSIQGALSYDSQFTTAGGVFDRKWSTGLNIYRLFIDPAILDMNTAINPATGKPFQTVADFLYGRSRDAGTNEYDFVMLPQYFIPENMGYQSNGTDYWGLSYPAPYRRTFYQFQANYARVFDKHDVGALFLVNRELYAEGSMFPRYREDWVGRITYNYDSRYLFETNGAYNGSEKFAKGKRFGFFPSVAVGWMISNESFLKKDWLDKLKVRYSIGKVGNDNFNSPRWAYGTNWVLDDRVNFGTPTSTASYYQQYKQAVIGNPDLSWEASTKQNYGLELAVFKNRVNLNFDYFKDHRTNIFMSASQRQIPTYFGASPVAANIGETKTKGYELELKLQNSTKGNFHHWLTWTYTHAIDEVIFQEDPALLPEYRKAQGKQIDQTRAQTYVGILNNWDDVYSSLSQDSNNQYKLPGEYRMVDYNGDGTLNSFDSAPYAYPNRPQNTYSISAGIDYKGFSAMIQFYGVYNVIRQIGNVTNFSNPLKSVTYQHNANFWTPENPITSTSYGPTKALRLNNGTTPDGTQWLFDASYLRLKTAEIAYTLSGNWIKRLQVNSARIYINGNNLLFWSDLIDDLEAPTFDSRTGYPMYKRVNLGISINF